MKRFLSLIAIAALTIFGCYAKVPVAKGNSNSELGMFVLERSEAPIIVGWKILDTYDLIYENSGVTVRIVIDDSDKKCRKYIVFSDDICIQYTCNGRMFGSSMPDQKYVLKGDTTSLEHLDKEEYFRQKVISQTTNSELEQLKLIAVYFPRLVKEYQEVFDVK
ncbi:MAG TPA: hypothetical protein VMW76_07950 [Bacteroidales bacterium]|nr:hypothetical protein [Bacteroidales bacterium]